MPSNKATQSDEAKQSAKATPSIADAERDPWILRSSRLFASGLLDLILPPRCAACGAIVDAEASFCEPCAVGLVAPEDPCPRCGEPGGARSCPRCRRHAPAFVHLEAPFLYGGPLADAIHHLKYDRRSNLAGPLARLWSTLALAELPVDRVVPIPLHRRRLAWRGYNQATLLARPLARSLHLPLDCGSLIRRRETKSQTRLSARARRANVDGAFEVRQPKRVAGQRLLLVDDVATTGATLDAAARALLAHGATSVHALVLARAESSS